MIKDPSSQNLFHTEQLPHAKVFKSGKSNFSSGGLKKRKNQFKRTEDSDNITQDDEFHDEEDKESEPEDEQEHDLEDEEDEKHDEDHEEYEDTDDDSTVNDEVDNIRNPNDSPSLKMMRGKIITKKKHRTIPQDRKSVV